MKIGFDARMIDWAGVGTYTYNVLESLKEIDKENQYVLLCEQKTMSQVPEADNFDKRIVSESVFSSFHQLFFSLSLKKHSLDVFHAPYFTFPLFLSCPSVVTIHDLIPLVFPLSMPSKIGRAYYQRANKKALNKAKMIIAVSESTKNDLLNNYDVSKEKIRVICDGVSEKFKAVQDRTLLSRVKKRYGIRSRFLMNVGNPKPHKNWPGLIEAFAESGKKVKDCRLVLVGSRDPRYPEIERLIRKLQLKDRVIVTGFVDEGDMPLLYNAAEALVLPSFYEGFGLPVLEAMACGTPVLSSSSSALPEVCGDAALMVDANEPANLVAGIERILSDEKLRRELSDKGTKRAKLFSWKQTAQKTLEVYQEIKC